MAQGSFAVFHVLQYLIGSLFVTIEFGKVPFLDLRSCCSFNKEYHLKKPMILTRLFHFHRLFDHIAFSFHAGAESPVELLDHPCFSILCLLCLRLSILPRLTTAGH